MKTNVLRKTENTWEPEMMVPEEAMALLDTTPGMRLTLAYSEQDGTLQFTVNSPHPIDPDVFRTDNDDLSMTILRNFSSDIHIDGNMLSVMISQCDSFPSASSRH